MIKSIITIADNKHTRQLCIAGMQAVIEREIAEHTYSVLVIDMDGLPGPYTLIWADLDIGATDDELKQETQAQRQEDLDMYDAIVAQGLARP